MNWKRFLVFATALGQILSSYFGGFRGEETFTGPIISPANYAYAIWGLITLGCLVYGIYQVLPGQQKNTLFDRMSVPLIGTFTGFSLWIYSATQLWLWATVLIFIMMLVCLWWAYSYILKSKNKLTLFERRLFHGTFGMYIGWATVATIINAVTAMTYYKYVYPDQRSTSLFVVVLVAALFASLEGLRRIRYNPYYLATILWAFIAVAVRTSQEGAAVLTAISMGAVGCVFVFWSKHKK